MPRAAYARKSPPRPNRSLNRVFPESVRTRSWKQKSPGSVGRWRKAPDLTPVLVLKTGNYHLHHGCLGIVRSLGSMGVPVHIISESRRPPAAASRFLAGNFVWDTHGLSTGQLLEGLERIARLLNRPAVIIPTDDRG